MTTTPRRRARRRHLTLALGVLALVVVPSVALANHVFTDVGDNDVHAPGIEYLDATGITTGCATNPDRFCPGDPLTRAQMGTFIFRSSGHDPATPPSVNAASINTIEMVEDANSVNGSAVNSAAASCPDGMLATGGGSQTTDPQGWRLSSSRPLADGTGWTAQYVQKDGNLGINTTTVWALCVPAGPQ